MQWRNHAILQPPSDDEICAMEPDELMDIHKVYHEAIDNAERDPYRYGFRLPHWEKAEEQLSQVSEVLALGGNRCLSPDQLIYDPVLDKYTAVSEINGPFHVWAWNGQERIVARALQPYLKPQAKTYRVLLSNGDSVTCSAAHRVSTPFGWRSVTDISLGGVVSLLGSNSQVFSGVNWQQECSPFLAPSISGRFPSRLRLNVLRLIQRVLDFLDDCPSSPHFYGGQLPSLVRIDPSLSRPQDDVLKCSEYASLHLGDHKNKSQCTHLYSPSVHPSIPCEGDHCEGHCEAFESHAYYRVLKSQQLTTCDRIFERLGWISLGVSDLVRSVFLIRHPVQCVLRLISCALIKPYEAIIVKVYDKQVCDIWDIEVPETGNYFIGDILQKNSGKTAWGSYCVVKAAIENPKSEIFCFSQTSEVSIRQQQSAVWNWIPNELRTKQTSANAYISYTKKNGFTDNSLIFPNGSQIIFKTYSQYQNNPTILEGAELGSKDPKWHNIGVWLDEYLLGNELIDTLRFRLATRNSKLLLTFTPIDGWTEVIKEYLDGATTIENVKAELLNDEIVPYVQRSKKRNASVHYFHSKDNPFGGYERIKETLMGRSREEILIRAYGVPVKSHATKFPRFNKEVNVVKPQEIPTTNVTRYHVIDPAGAKNWFMCWIAVDESNTYWVYREWPGVDVGDWAEWRGGKWVGGAGSKGQGFGIKDYVDTILELEEGEEIFERLIDPRLGAAKYQAADSSSSIIEDLNEQEIICIPAPGMEIDDGLQALISKMSWDTTKPIDSVNRPHFYVSSDCENIIQALSEYTGEGGLKEAWKDPIDVLRYAAIAGVDHVDESRSYCTRQGSGGY